MSASPYGNDNNTIRFDGTDLNSLKKHVVILGIPVGILAAVILMSFGIWGTSSGIKDYQIAIGVGSLYALPVWGLFFLKYLIKWGNCRNYLAKLKMRKMQIPERKEDFHCNLTELVTEETRELERENGTAIWKVAISVVPAVCFLAWGAYLTLEYSAEVIPLTIPVFLFWAFVILQTVLHCSERKYKDETNPDPTRKPRASFFSFLAFVLFFAIASACWMGMVQSMANYVDRSVKDRDVSFLSGINTAALCSLHDLNDDSMGKFTIVIEKDRLRIEGSDKDLTEEEARDFIETFMALTDDAAGSLETVNEELDSRAFGTLEKLEIIVDVQAGSTKLVATPKKKGVEPLVISSGGES